MKFLALTAALMLANAKPVLARDHHDNPPRTGPELAIDLGFIDSHLFVIGYNLTSTVATLLDKLSDTQTNLAGGPFPPFTAEENAVLGEVGALLTDDIKVDTNGLVFTGKNMVLGGMRLVHSIRENNAKRYEATPSLVSIDLDRPLPQFTMSTRQQHWWTDPITQQQVVAQRTTLFTIVRSNGKWRFKEITLRTVIGPNAVDFGPFASPYGQ